MFKRVHHFFILNDATKSIYNQETNRDGHPPLEGNPEENK